MPTLNIPKENVIGLAYEPFEYLYLTYNFIEYAKKYIGKYFIGSKYNLPEPFMEYFAYMGHTIPPNKIPSKLKKMSIIFSDKKDAIGHKYRHELVNIILKTNLPIDIYGRGCDTLLDIKDDRIKGKFVNNEPYLEYNYHIAIENFRHNAYISEKFMNCLLCKCIPIYLGAYKVDDYFPNSCFKLSGNIEIDIKLITAICDGKMVSIKKNIEYPSKMKFIEFIKNEW
jgi:hypothetical protein